MCGLAAAMIVILFHANRILPLEANNHFDVYSTCDVIN